VDKCPGFSHLIVIPRLQVQNANAISSPHTHGFPSMTAFLGLMWALERKTAARGLDLQFNAIGVVVHKHQELSTKGGFLKTFRLTRNPIQRDGKTSAIVEEGRIHLDLSLVLAVQSDSLEIANETTKREIAGIVKDIITHQRIAGGSVVPSSASRWKQTPYVSLAEDFERVKMRLLPGFVMVERQDLLDSRYQSMVECRPAASRLEAWLSLSSVNWNWREEADGTSGSWEHDRTGLGWLVPIPLGYAALTEVQAPGTVTNARDEEVPFCFVESIFGIGQWLSPHRINRVEEMLWYADSRPENGLYGCGNDYSVGPTFDFN